MISKVLKGGAIFGAGSIGSAALQFLIIFFVVRLVEKADYGVLSLCMAVTHIGAFLAMLGLGSGAPVYIAKKGVQGEEAEAIVGSTSFYMVLAFSTAATILVILLTEAMTTAMDKPEAASAMRWFACIIIPTAALNSLEAIYRGKSKAVPKVAFHDIGQFVVRLLLLPICFLTAQPLLGVMGAFVISTWVAAIAFFIYALPYFKLSKFRFDPVMARELLGFSLPLLGYRVFSIIMTWALTFSLGFTQTSEELADFSAPMRISQFLNVPLQAILFLYLPQATKAFEMDSIEKVRSLYVSSTKWLIIIALPIIWFIILDAEFLTAMLLSERYAGAGMILSVLCFGIAAKVLLGPNGMTLVALGAPRPVFYGSVTGAAITALGCFFLVPHSGAIGAAWTYTVSMIALNVIISIILFKKNGAHLLYKKIILPLIVFLLAASILHFGIISLHEGMAAHFISCLLFYPLAYGCWKLLRGFDEEDNELIAAVMKKVRGKNGDRRLQQENGEA